MENNPINHRGQFFRLLLVFRWVSLIPPVLLVQRSSRFALDLPPVLVLLLAVLVNLVITLWNEPLNRLLRERPWILAFELGYSTGLLLLTGGVDSPYYLQALSPLLAGAFFFQVRGGLVTGAVFSAMYLAGMYFLNTWVFSEAQLTWLILQLVGIGVFPTIVGAVSGVTTELHAANEAIIRARQAEGRRNIELQGTHLRLQTIHDLTTLLQAAPDVGSMQEQVLRILAASINIRGALLGILQPGEMVLHSWKALNDGELLEGIDAKIPPVSLRAPAIPLLAEVLQSREPHRLAQNQRSALPAELTAWAAGQEMVILPLIFHEEPVGMLFLQGETAEALEDEELTMVRTLSNQAATSLGTTMLCVERARDLAVEQERNRIAREIHDTVSQSLFGMVYSLDACIRMLPETEDRVKSELGEIQDLANLTRDQVRHSIFDLWPSSLTLDVFQEDLSLYVSHCFRVKQFEIHYDISGDFDALSPAIRRNLYRITQEALSNTMHHAGVAEAQVVMSIGEEELNLVVVDEGVGFELENALGREYSREHFGLHGIRERALAMHGDCEIKSERDQGTRIQVRVPLTR